MKNKWVAVLLAFFLGGLGIHRFYVRDTKWGVIFLVFSWTAIPAIIGLIDAIRWAFMDEAEFHAKYSPAFKYGNGSGAAQAAAIVLACGLLFGAHVAAAADAWAVKYQFCSTLAQACQEAYNVGAQSGRCDWVASVAAQTVARYPYIPTEWSTAFIQAMTGCCLNGVYGTNWGYEQAYQACVNSF